MQKPSINLIRQTLYYLQIGKATKNEGESESFVKKFHARVRTHSLEKISPNFLRARWIY